MSQRSPTSLKVTLRQMRLGKSWSISEAFQREHQIAAHFMRHPDFVEGVKARLMSKPPRQAEWQPATLEEVTTDQVDQFFSVPEGEELMDLLSETNYESYPHAQYGLPSENDIQGLVQRVSNTSQEAQEFANFGKKEGAREKLAEVLARRTVLTAEGRKWN
jgi:3-hydroxyisobutyryl-CoA hydrolase